MIAVKWTLAGLALSIASLPTPARAQEASYVVTLGKDTVAVEKMVRSGTRITGEVATRLGATGTRVSYVLTLAADGKPLSAVYQSRPLTGAPAATAAREIRVTFMGDSVKREAVFADSTNTRILPAAKAVPFVYPAFGMLEVGFAQFRKSKAPTLGMAVVGLGAANPSIFTITARGGDTLSVAGGGGLITLYRADKDGKVLAVDASGTTQKMYTTRGGPIDFEGIVARFVPMGQLSQRGNASGSFLQSVVFINYGRPQVRGRSVWGGLLVPPDTIWRLGANEATHLATSRELTFGSVVLPPGLYTLWLFNGAGAPQLVINRQVGQWGTAYDPAQDLGRVPLTMAATPEHVEDFTITIRNTGQGRGAIDFAWGSQMATANFTVR